MKVENRLRFVAVVYLLVGVTSLVEEFWLFIEPSRIPLISVFIFDPRLNFAMLLLPVGIGLWLRNGFSRRLAITMSWALIAMDFMYPEFLGFSLYGGDGVEWPDGGSPSSLLEYRVFVSFGWLGMIFFFWQLVQLQSRELRLATESG